MYMWYTYTYTHAVAYLIMYGSYVTTTTTTIVATMKTTAAVVDRIAVSISYIYDKYDEYT